MNCDTCKTPVQPVPYIAHESAQARNERTVKRLIAALVILIFAFFASNALWLWAWTSYDYSGTESVVEYQQDGEGLNIIGDRNTAGVCYESNSQDNTENTDAHP